MALDNWQTADRTKVAAFFAQDSWTRGRLTVQGGAALRPFSSFSPAEHNGTTATTRSTRRRSPSPQTASVDAYNDLTPRFGVAYDVFGNGKTALKFNMGHYLVSATNDGRYTRTTRPTVVRQSRQPRLDRQQRQQGGGLRSVEPRHQIPPPAATTAPR